jgi:hypothetical protein
MAKDKNSNDDLEIKKKKKKKKKKKVVNVVHKEKKESVTSRLLDKIIGLFKKKDKKKSEIVTPIVVPAKDDLKGVEKKEEANKAKEDDFVDDLFKDFDDIGNEDEDEKVEKKKVSKSIASKKEEEEEDESDDDKDEDEDSATKKIRDKFLSKDGIKKPKSLREIAEESKKKSDEMKGQAFTEGDAAKQDIKKSETGYNQVVKKKTKNALKGKIFLIRGKDNGRPAWHYILVPPENVKILKKQKAGSNIDVTDYGKIVRSGWGENPSDKIVKEIEAEYGD